MKSSGFFLFPAIPLIPIINEIIDIVNSEIITADNNINHIIITNSSLLILAKINIVDPNNINIDDIHDKLETLLGEEGAYIDALYYCPHHPDKGYEGERPEYKIECNCRKPKPGMLLKAGDDFNIDLSQSWMIGDDVNDILAGQNAGCKTIKLDKDFNLLKAVKRIIGEE